MNRHALNHKLSKQRGIDIRPGFTFYKIKNYFPLVHESQMHFYSECLYTQIFWTETRDWAQPPLKGNYTKRDRLLGLAKEDGYSIDNTLLLKARASILEASTAGKKIKDLRDRLKRQMQLLLIVLKYLKKK